MAKRPRDFNQLAKLTVDIASFEVEDRVSAKMRSNGPVRGRAGGLKGGNVRKASLTSEQRAEIARKAATARWRSKA